MMIEMIDMIIMMMKMTINVLMIELMMTIAHGSNCADRVKMMIVRVVVVRVEVIISSKKNLLKVMGIVMVAFLFDDCNDDDDNDFDDNDDDNGNDDDHPFINQKINQSINCIV